MVRKYSKLIRDNIPEICKSNDTIAVTKVLKQDEYVTALESKLIEEVNEYLESKELEELADILEVIDSIAKTQNLNFDELIEIKKQKAAKNGSFDKRLFLFEVRDIEGK